MLTAVVVTSVPASRRHVDTQRQRLVHVPARFEFLRHYDVHVQRTRQRHAARLERNAGDGDDQRRRPVNDAPTAVADVFATTENVPLVVAAPGHSRQRHGSSTAARLTAVLVIRRTEQRYLVTDHQRRLHVHARQPDSPGTATFTYRAVDNGTPPLQSAAVATVTITVTGVNDPPVANADTYAATEDTVLNIAAPGVLANDTDPDPGTVLNAVVVAQPDTRYAHVEPERFVQLLARARLSRRRQFPLSRSRQRHPAATKRRSDRHAQRRQRQRCTALRDRRDGDTAPNGDAKFAVHAFVGAVLRRPRGVASDVHRHGTARRPHFHVGRRHQRHAVHCGNGSIHRQRRGQRRSKSSSPRRRSRSTVLAAGRTDLALSAAATPSPALINQPITWTFTVENRSPVENVANLSLQIVFMGPPSFAITPSTRCVVTPESARTTVACTAGPVLANGRATITVNGSSAQAGDVVATATVAITDAVPIDATPDNNTTTTVVNVAQTIAAGPAQTLPATGLRASASGDFNGDGFIDFAVAAEAAVAR